MNITNIKRVWFNDYERAITNAIIGWLYDETESGDEWNFQISFYKDTVTIHQLTDDETLEPRFVIKDGVVVQNDLEPSADNLRLYCKVMYVRALTEATESIISTDRTKFMTVKCLTDELGEEDFLSIEIYADRLDEVTDYLCPSLLVV